MNDLKLCNICKKGPDKPGEFFLCDKCKNPICQKCSGLTVTEIRVMELKNGRTLKYECRDCGRRSRGTQDQLNSIEKRILDEVKKLYMNFEVNIQNIIEKEVQKLQETVIVNCEKMNDHGKPETYANITGKKDTNEVIVIKPKERQESSRTKTDIKEKINPGELAIAVDNIRNGRDGAVVISCNDRHTKEKITEKVENELNGKYSVLNVKQKNPKIKIIGVEEEFVREEDNVIIETLKKQNDLNMTDTSLIEVHSKYFQRNKKNNGNIILTVDPTLKNKICSIKKLNIGWRRCLVQEYFPIIRCFKCARYGHMASKCENNLTCFRCSDQHKTEDCDTERLKCINCLEANIRLGRSLDVNHSATDYKCPCYQRILSMETKKIKTQ